MSWGERLWTASAFAALAVLLFVLAMLGRQLPAAGFALASTALAAVCVVAAVASLAALRWPRRRSRPSRGSTSTESTRCA